MAIATKTKPKSTHNKKRTAAHHRQSKHYVKSYLPYLPMLAVIGIGIFVNSMLHRPTAVLGVQSNLSQQALVDETNVERVTNRQSPLKWNAELQLAAQAKARDMVSQDYWSHETPTGSEPWSFITNTGYQYQTAGENLAYGFNSAKTIMGAWMQSDEHRTNLLSGSYSEVGFGTVQAADYLGKGPQTIVVAMYALPSSESNAVAAPLNTTPTAMTPVSRLETIAPTLSGVIVGAIGSLAVVIVLVRHSFAWRKLLNRGEMFVITHPVLDTMMVTVAVAAVILNSTVGVIR